MKEEESVWSQAAARPPDRYRDLPLYDFTIGKCVGNGIIEAPNRKANQAFRNAYAFKALEIAQICLINVEISGEKDPTRQQTPFPI